MSNDELITQEDLERLSPNLEVTKYYSLFPQNINGIVLKEEGRYRISHNQNYPLDRGNGFLEKIDERRGFSSLGGYDLCTCGQNKGKWEVGILLPYDEETDSDYGLIGVFDTKEEAVEALWNERFNVVI